jgi:hypothetical protein
MSEITPGNMPAEPEPPEPLTDAFRVATAPQLESERVIVAAPMSFAGSAQRIWRMTGQSAGWAKAALGTLAVFIILLAWMLVLCWYLFFGLLLVPYRIIRRGQRKGKKQALQHREMLAAIERNNRR